MLLQHRFLLRFAIPARGLARHRPVGEQFKEETESMGKQVGETIRTTKESAGKVAEDVKEMASQAMQAAKEILTGHPAEQAKKAASEMYEETEKVVKKPIEKDEAELIKKGEALQNADQEKNQM
jgi:NifB/MoaA-like Fe-S oxidoreductase